MKKINKKDNEDYNFVLKFNKIRLTKICEKLKLSRTSINSGNSTLENYHKVRREIERELAKLYLLDLDSKEEFNSKYDKLVTENFKE